MKRNYSFGLCKLKDLRKGDYFRTLDKKGNISRETYKKGNYCRSTKKYDCDKCSDIWGNGRSLKGDTIVTTEFFY